MSEPIRPGVLALQGSVEPHVASLRALGANPAEVRNRRELAALTHLIIPGGESTTLHHLLGLFDMTKLLVERVEGGELVVFGTCAGAILIGRVADERPPRLGLLDVAVARNAYGRQVDSFTGEVSLETIGGGAFPAVFIRAPRIIDIGKGVRVIGRRGDEPVLVEAPGLLASTFHPELTRDLRIHAHFLAMSPRGAPRNEPHPTVA